MSNLNAARARFWALQLYAISSLIAMAPMSVGAVVFTAVFLATYRPGSFTLDSKLRPYTRATLALVAAILASLAFAIVFPVVFAGEWLRVPILQNVFKLWYFLLPFMIAAALGKLSRAQREAFVERWSAVYVVLACVGVIQFFTGWPREQAIPGLEGRFHAILFLGHHLSVASVWIFPLFLFLDHSFRSRVWKVTVVVSGLITLFLTFARSAWIATPVAFATYALLRLRGRARGWAIGAMAATLIGAATLPAVRDRIGHSMGIAERVRLWRVNLELFRDRPLLGVGFRQNEEAAHAWFRTQNSVEPGTFIGHAHNNWIEALAGIGLLGFAAFFWWNAVVLRTLWRVRAVAPYAIGLFCAWIAFHINGLTQVNFWEGKVMHQMAWALGWMIYGITQSRH